MFVGEPQIPTSVTVVGKTSVLTPEAAGESERVMYTAQVMDQHGGPIVNADVVWTLDAQDPLHACQGVAIDSQSGVLTVTMTRACDVVVVATATMSAVRVEGNKTVHIKPLGPTTLSVIGVAAIPSGKTGTYSYAATSPFF